MRISVETWGGVPADKQIITITCPECGHDGTFDQLSAEDIFTGPHYHFGQRRCPNPRCHSHLFFISENREIVATLPARRIDFDKTDIPTRIVSIFAQAIACHAEACFMAAAMMIRRTLEEICSDREATGENLKEKIKSLRDKIVLPDELFKGMDDLRLLGNDAAHIESRDFNDIGEDEIEIGIEFTKEILKAVYQYKHLLEKLRGLKKKPAPSSGQ